MVNWSQMMLETLLNLRFVKFDHISQYGQFWKVLVETFNSVPKFETITEREAQNKLAEMAALQLKHPTHELLLIYFAIPSSEDWTQLKISQLLHARTIAFASNFNPVELLDGWQSVTLAVNKLNTKKITLKQAKAKFEELEAAFAKNPKDQFLLNNFVTKVEWNIQMYDKLLQSRLVTFASSFVGTGADWPGVTGAVNTLGFNPLNIKQARDKFNDLKLLFKHQPDNTFLLKYFKPDSNPLPIHLRLPNLSTHKKSAPQTAVRSFQPQEVNGRLTQAPQRLAIQNKSAHWNSKMVEKMLQARLVEYSKHLTIDQRLTNVTNSVNSLGYPPLSNQQVKSKYDDLLKNFKKNTNGPMLRKYFSLSAEGKVLFAATADSNWTSLMIETLLKTRLETYALNFLSDAELDCWKLVTQQVNRVAPINCKKSVGKVLNTFMRLFSGYQANPNGNRVLYKYFRFVSGDDPFYVLPGFYSPESPESPDSVVIDLSTTPDIVIIELDSDGERCEEIPDNNTLSTVSEEESVTDEVIESFDSGSSYSRPLSAYINYRSL